MDILAGQYRIDDEIGRGGMAIVYRAWDTRHDRAVAVKTLMPEVSLALGAERFLREVRLAAGLNHPHIVPVHDSGDAGGLLYYVMPLIEGRTLREHMQRVGQMPSEDVFRLAGQIAGALDYAHRLGIVHRDIKPENIMLHEGEALITDFGIARALSSVGDAALTQTGIALGTPAYMSPEQAAGEVNIDGRSDQYSLACLVYEMLTGEPLFSAGSAQALIAKRFSAKPPSFLERQAEAHRDCAARCCANRFSEKRGRENATISAKLRIVEQVTHVHIERHLWARSRGPSRSLRNNRRASRACEDDLRRTRNRRAINHRAVACCLCLLLLPAQIELLRITHVDVV